MPFGSTVDSVIRTDDSFRSVATCKTDGAMESIRIRCRCRAQTLCSEHREVLLEVDLLLYAYAA